MSDHFQRALVLRNLNRHDEARKELYEWLKTEPDDASAHTLLAECLYESKANFPREEVIREAELAVSLEPDWAHGYYVLAWLENKFGNYDRVFEVIGQAIEIDPENASYHSERGFAFYRLKRYEEARTSFQRCLKIDPDFYHAFRLLSHLENECGNKYLATGYADAALRLAPEDAAAFVAKAEAAVSALRHDEAIPLFREAVRLNPNNEYAKRRLEYSREVEMTRYLPRKPWESLRDWLLSWIFPVIMLSIMIFLNKTGCLESRSPGKRAVSNKAVPQWKHDYLGIDEKTRKETEQRIANELLFRNTSEEEKLLFEMMLTVQKIRDNPPETSSAPKDSADGDDQSVLR